MTAAARDPQGVLALSGRAQAGARVTLVSPAGDLHAAQAGADGRWALSLPSAEAPRVFALSAAVRGEGAAPGRVVRAEGALLLAPAPAAPAMVMRGGAPDLPVAAPGVGLRWATVDMDAGGGAAVSGFAPPGTAVRLAVDGQASVAGESDAVGRFGVLWLGAPVTPGQHAVSVGAGAQSRTVRLRFGAAAPLSGAPARFTREPVDWRVDWAPSGGGVQTTLVLDPPGAADTPASPGAAQ